MRALFSRTYTEPEQSYELEQLGTRLSHPSHVAQVENNLRAKWQHH